MQIIILIRSAKLQASKGKYQTNPNDQDSNSKQTKWLSSSGLVTIMFESLDVVNWILFGT
jgi:hypothetical protein